MTSEKSETSADLSSLKEDIQANAATIHESDDVASLRERVDRVELLAEQFGRAQNIQDEFPITYLT